MKEFTCRYSINGSNILIYNYEESGLRLFIDYEEISSEEIFQMAIRHVRDNPLDIDFLYKTYYMANLMANKNCNFFKNTFCDFINATNGMFDINYLAKKLSEYMENHPIEIPTINTYLAKNDHNNNVKIGKARDISKRLSSLKTSDPSIFIIGYVQRDIEKELHQKLEAYRFDREWFLLSDKQINDLMNEYKFITN